MFTTLEKIAQSDPKFADVILLENYAAFQNRFLRKKNHHILSSNLFRYDCYAFHLS